MSKIQIFFVLIGGVLLALSLIDYANDTHGRYGREIYTGMLLALAVIIIGVFI